jgi:hypothetical protein
MALGRCEYCGTREKGETHMELWRFGKPVPEEEYEEALRDIRSLWVEVEG